MMNKKRRYYVAPNPDGIYEVWLANETEMKQITPFAYGPYQTEKAAKRQALASNRHNATQDWKDLQQKERLMEMM